MKKNLLYSILTVITTLVLYLCLYPVPFDPVEYDYPSNPGFTGPYEKNNELSTANQLLMGIGKGPEDITIGPDSFFYTGFEDGRIVRFTQEGKLLETIVNTGGRPLGIQFDKNDNLIVADAYKGLISISLQGDVQVLADSVDGTEIYYADDLDIGKDGTIWFSDATQRHHENILLDYMGLQATGRLLSYNPRTKKTKVELSGLRFANGVALGPNEDYILVTETIGARIHKLWINGPSKGKHEVFPVNLPGYPDNISYNGNGIFWVALPAIRVSSFESLSNKPFRRKVIARLPSFLTGYEESSKGYGFIIGFDTLGQVVYNLQDSIPNYYSITSVNEFDGFLYLGSNVMESAGKYSIKQ